MSPVSVKSAARVLDLLEFLAARPESIRVNELARQLLIPKSSLSSLLATLVARGYVDAAAGGFRLAAAHRESWVGGEIALLKRSAHPIMSKLVARTAESAFLGVLTPDWRVGYIEKVVSENPLRYDVDLALLRPAYCTSIGHVLLAGQDDKALGEYIDTQEFAKVTPRTVTDPVKIHRAIKRVRTQGFAPIADSHVLGASGVAAPIRSGSGRTIAGLAVIAPSPRFEPSREAITMAVIDAAREFTRHLSTTPSVQQSRT